MIREADIARFQSALPGLKVLVVGDLMLDRYHFGRVTRISPEAPVPVVDIERIDSRPGGAANVALNIRGMGASVTLCGLVGRDDDGALLLRTLEGGGFETNLIVEADGRPTTTKTRIIGNNQQILRVDHESRDQIGPEVELRFLEMLQPRIGQFDAVVVEDYDKGLLGPNLIGFIVGLAGIAGVPVLVDPKHRNFMSYKDVTLFKPNLQELNEALHRHISRSDLPGILSAVHALRRTMPHSQTLVTLSENGMLAIDAEGNPTHLPAHFRKVVDVSGAGDTVIALMALSMASGLALTAAAAIANLGGGIVCEEVGVVPVDRESLFRELRAIAH
ncbi:MAG: hypothetical protein RLZZ165_73 [Bacteroidota bacterium]|jgi:rfaE bifunctional protein kinase chain/domain